MTVVFVFGLALGGCVGMIFGWLAADDTPMHRRKPRRLDASGKRR